MWLLLRTRRLLNSRRFLSNVATASAKRKVVLCVGYDGEGMHGSQHHGDALPTVSSRLQAALLAQKMVLPTNMTPGRLGANSLSLSIECCGSLAAWLCLAERMQWDASSRTDTGSFFVVQVWSSRQQPGTHKRHPSTTAQACTACRCS